MARAEVLNYTEKDKAAIAILEANKGTKLSAKQLGIANATLTSLITKAGDERPMAEGVTRVIVNKEFVEEKCPVCGKDLSHFVYWVE